MQFYDNFTTKWKFIYGHLYDLHQLVIHNYPPFPSPSPNPYIVHNLKLTPVNFWRFWWSSWKFTQNVCLWIQIQQCLKLSLVQQKLLQGKFFFHNSTLQIFNWIVSGTFVWIVRQIRSGKKKVKRNSFVTKENHFLNEVMCDLLAVERTRMREKTMSNLISLLAYNKIAKFIICLAEQKVAFFSRLDCAKFTLKRSSEKSRWSECVCATQIYAHKIFLAAKSINFNLFDMKFIY